jgi:hypothetical protein
LRQGALFASSEDLLAAIHEIVAGIPQETLPGVFQHWMERFEWASQNNGEYYPYTADWMIQVLLIFIKE